MSNVIPTWTVRILEFQEYGHPGGHPAFQWCSAHHLLWGRGPPNGPGLASKASLVHLSRVAGRWLERGDTPTPRSSERRGLGVEPRSQRAAGFNFARCATSSSRHASPEK